MDDDATAGARLLGEGFDEVLVAARRGDEWAWTALYHDLAPVLLRWLRSQRAPAPEDLVSEVLLNVVRDLSQFSGDEGAFRAWVFTIARHRTIDLRRHQQRRPATAVDSDELQRLCRADDDAALQVVETVTTEELLDLLDELSPSESEVLTLRYLAGLSQREVADVIGKKLNNVKQLQKRGLRSLRTVVAGLSYPIAGSESLIET